MDRFLKRFLKSKTKEQPKFLSTLQCTCLYIFYLSISEKKTIYLTWSHFYVPALGCVKKKNPFC